MADTGLRDHLPALCNPVLLATLSCPGNDMPTVPLRLLYAGFALVPGEQTSSKIKLLLRQLKGDFQQLLISASASSALNKSDIYSKHDSDLTAGSITVNAD